MNPRRSKLVRVMTMGLKITSTLAGVLALQVQKLRANPLDCWGCLPNRLNPALWSIYSHVDVFSLNAALWSIYRHVDVFSLDHLTRSKYFCFGNCPSRTIVLPGSVEREAAHHH